MGALVSGSLGLEAVMAGVSRIINVIEPGEPFGEDIEFAVLDRIGLFDGIRVLDLGSGPGVTAMLMAKRLPSATVIGVEPEDLLRTKAKTLVERQGFAGRCRFLKGTGNRIPVDDGILHRLEDLIRKPTTFAMTTVFVAFGVVA
jgi:tRNA A58 N-methylase Trm61